MRKFNFKGKEVKHKGFLIWTGRDNTGFQFAGSICNLDGDELLYIICPEKEPILRAIDDYLHHARFVWKPGLYGEIEYAILGDYYLIIEKQGRKWKGSIQLPNVGYTFDAVSDRNALKWDLERRVPKCLK